MKLEIGFGSCPQTVELPDETVLDVLYPNGIEAPADSAAEVARALLSPIGTPPLAELAKGKQKVAIVTSDITRPMPSAVVLPLVLDELYRAGVCPESVTVVFALGSHRRQTEEEKLHLAGEEVYRQVTCVDSLDFDFVHMGDTKRGTPVDICRPVAEADLVVSVCKLKTHSMTTLSGGVKNLFGCIPGLQKPELHLRFPEKADFGEMLVDLALTVKPALTIVDAVVGMEGDGPSGGSPRKLGFLAACQNPFLLDLALCRIIGVTPESVPTIAASQRRGLCPESADALSFAGEVQFARPVPGFVPPHAKSVDFLSHTPRLLRPAVSRLWDHLTPRPVIRRKDCVGCGRCAESCPAHTITIVSGKAQIRYDRCIHCYCCHEMCPVRAIDIRRTRFFDL